MESAHANYEKKRAALRLKPENKLTLGQIARQIKESGFTAKSAKVTVKGEIVRSGSRYQLKISGTGKSLDLIGDATALATIVGRTETVNGSLTPVKDLSEKTPLRLSPDPIALDGNRFVEDAHLSFCLVPPRSFAASR